MNQPLVSIFCLSYNHVQFIRKCLKSLVAQKCDFKYEILIHDDASTDGTQEIIKEFQERYPELIKPIFQKENQWSKKPGGNNLLFNYPRAKGKYIALCETDDFWIGEDKLQKQIDFLKQNPDCLFVCGGYLMIKNNKQQEFIKKNESHSQKGFYFDLDDLKESWFIRPSTAVFRNLPEKLDQLKKYEFTFDVHLFYLLLKNGKGFYFSELLAGYNRHSGGVYSGSSTQDLILMQYLIAKEIFEEEKDDFMKDQFFRAATYLLNLKISGLLYPKKIKTEYLKDRIPRFKIILKDIKPLISTPAQKKLYLKSFIPFQMKFLINKIRSLI